LIPDSCFWDSGGKELWGMDEVIFIFITSLRLVLFISINSFFERRRGGPLLPPPGEQGGLRSPHHKPCAAMNEF